MKILVACEESQAVTIAFRNKGHEAYSCDIQECSGGHPEWHIKGDVLEQIYIHHSYRKWDMMIAFPPCTHLAVSGAAWFEQKRKDGRQQQGIDFFMKIANADIPKKVIENPIGIMSKIYRKPDQIIQPYYFGDEAQKSTCLWLTNLHPLFHCEEDDLFFKKTHVGKGDFVVAKSGKKMAKWFADAWRLGPAERSKLRSKTFPGIAAAMADQWG